MAVPDGGDFVGDSVAVASSASFSTTTMLPKPMLEDDQSLRNAIKSEKDKVGEENNISSLHDTTSCGGGGGPSSSSSSSMNTREIEKAAVEVEVEEEKIIKATAMTVKVEEEEEEDHIGSLNELKGGGSGDISINHNGISSSSCSSVGLPKPMEGLHETGPPPFLKKTFEMVEDSETDEIVSWSKNHDSFIVWDSHEFSKNLLPKYFKHSNFSSFIRQLNTYGFRKIDPDRWEFANEGFHGGKRHLLRTIKRRSRYNKQQRENVTLTGINDSTKPGVEAELENLKDDQDVLRLEILKIRQQQQESQTQLNAVEDSIQAAEFKQLRMLIFFTKAAKNPGFIQQLIQKRKQQGKLDGIEFRKKRRLLQTRVPQSLPGALDTNQSVNCRNHAKEQLTTNQTELTEILTEDVETCQISKLFPAPMSDEFCSPILQDHNANVMCETDTQDMSSVYNLMSEKLLDDSSVMGNLVDEEVDVDDSKLYLELEDLIGKPRMWGGCATELVGNTAGCVGSIP